jgi:2,4-dienoyl-CoA reductase-like NADH-dependent reductase (Old Yellow Enzyme family)
LSDASIRHGALFEPIQVGSVKLKNRLAMAPMTRSFADGGVHGDAATGYYERRAAGGVGLIISEGTSPPHPLAAGFPRVPELRTDEQQAAWAKIATAVKSHGTHMLIQLWHVGLLRNQAESDTPDSPSIGPSGIFPGYPDGRAMTKGDIDDVIDAFATAAETVQALGFSGIELHAAHGYIFDQFFWSETNRRTDRYGGGIADRTRFAVETVQEIRRRTGPDFLISLRFSQFKPPLYTARLAHSPHELEQFLEPLAASGIDLLHVSTRRFWLPEFDDSSLTLAGWTRKISGLPTITVGSVGLTGAFDPRQGVRETAGAADNVALEQVERMLERGDFDIVAIGRSLLANPDWGHRVAAHGAAGLAPYTRDAVDALV